MPITPHHYLPLLGLATLAFGADPIIAPGNSLVNGLGGSKGFGENVLSGNDDGSTVVNLTSVFPGGLRFYNATYTSVYLNNNGNLTFKSASGQYTPTAITGNSSRPIIAAWYADVYTTGINSTPTPGGNSTGANLVYYDLDPTSGIATFTWDDVGYYGGTNSSLRNAFQLRLHNLGAGDFAIEYRYEFLSWTTGAASGGSGGLGGSVARAGFSAGNGVNFYEFPASGNQAQMLALTTATNIGQPGVQVVRVVSPRADLMATNGGYFNGDTVNVDIQFASDVTGFTLSDLLVTGGTALSLVGSGATYTAVVQPTMEGTLNLTIPANAVLNQFLTGNAAASIPLFADRTAPVISVAPERSGNALMTLTGSVSDALSGMHHVLWSSDAPEAINFSAPGLASTGVTASRDGIYQLALTGTDRAGNSATSTMRLVWDTTPPVIQAIPDSYLRTSMTLTPIANDALSNVSSWRWRTLNGPGTMNFSDLNAAQPVVQATADGSYVVEVEIADQLGNAATRSTVVISDQTPPVVAAGPDLTVRGLSVALSASVSDVTSGIATRQWQIVSGPADARVEGEQFIANGAGIWTVRHEAVDRAGNLGADTLQIRLIEIPLVSAGPDRASNTPLTLAASATAARGFNITSVQWLQISGPAQAMLAGADDLALSVTSTVDGEYVFAITVTDDSGESATDTTIVRWDTTPPAVPVMLLPSAIVNATQPALAGSGEALAQVELLSVAGSLIGSATVAIDGNFVVMPGTAIADGSWTWEVRLVDAAGNRSATTAINRTIDTVPPRISIDLGGIAPLLGSTSVTATLVVDGPATVLAPTAVQVSNATAGLLVAASDGVTYALPLTVSLPGAISIQVATGAVVDAAGNPSPMTGATRVVVPDPSSLSITGLVTRGTSEGLGALRRSATGGVLSASPTGWEISVVLPTLLPVSTTAAIGVRDERDQLTTRTMTVEILAPNAQ